MGQAHPAGLPTARFRQLVQESENVHKQNALDPIPSAGNLYIGGIRALDQPELLKEAGITHILSVLEFDYCGQKKFAKYRRLWIPVDDDPRENVLRHFSTCNAFIQNALNNQGIVLVHCALGMSRAATFVCAYLMHAQGLSCQQAAEKVRETRPHCSPNPGFLIQLTVYQQMLASGSQPDESRLYRSYKRAMKTLPNT